jgi:hypothetical protein
MAAFHGGPQCHFAGPSPSKWALSAVRIGKTAVFVVTGRMKWKLIYF